MILCKKQRSRSVNGYTVGGRHTPDQTTKMKNLLIFRLVAEQCSACILLSEQKVDLFSNNKLILKLSFYQKKIYL